MNTGRDIAEIVFEKSSSTCMKSLCARWLLSTSIVRFSLSGENIASSKDRANETEGKKGSRRRLQRNRRESSSKFKSGDSKLGSCADKVTISD